MYTLTLVLSTQPIIFNMSDQCAIALDGSLKGAADIHWYNDVDDSAPIPSASHTGASSSTSSLAQSLDDFFSSCPPAKWISGACHSSQVCKPSKCTTDPDNAEAGNILEDVALGQKHRAGGAVSLAHRVSCKVVQSDSDDDTTSDNGNKSGLTDVDANSNEDMNKACATENWKQ